MVKDDDIIDFNTIKDIDSINCRKVQFQSELKNHKIQVELNLEHKEVLIYDCEINYEHIIELTMMLKIMCKKLSSFGFNLIVQYINPEDWNNFLSSISGFKLEKKYDDYYVINCPINEFPLSFLNGLGLNI